MRATNRSLLPQHTRTSHPAAAYWRVVEECDQLCLMTCFDQGARAHSCYPRNAAATRAKGSGTQNLFVMLYGYSDPGGATPYSHIDLLNRLIRSSSGSY